MRFTDRPMVRVRKAGRRAPDTYSCRVAARRGDGSTVECDRAARRLPSRAQARHGRRGVARCAARQTWQRMRPASAVERRRLNDTFARLCAIPSPFGSERACAEAVARELRTMGLGVEEDGVAGEVGAECGNLLARIPGRGERTILLCAHLDTVPEAGVIEPVVDDGGWVSAGDTILGADNKAAVAVILEVARRCAVEGSPVGLELLFTVSEENALAGAKAFDVEDARQRVGLRLRPRLADRRDHRRRTDVLPLRGRVSRHAGARRHPSRGRPQRGVGRRARDLRDAPRPHRRGDDRERRLDRGRRRRHEHRPGPLPGRGGDALAGPGQGRRVDRRAHRPHPRRRQHAGLLLRRRRHDAAALRGLPPRAQRARPCSPPSRPCAPAATRPSAAAPAAARTPTPSSAAGLHVTNLANGTERNHEPDERVAVAALEGMLDVTFALLDACSD